MFETTAINSILAVIITVVVCFIISTLLPGIERKYVHARIQQRIGPPVTSPGIMAPIKFLFKENIKPSSPVPGLYKALPIICFLVVLSMLIALTPYAFAIPALASLVAIVGLLKVEEICYVLMGSLSKSIMSVRMPFPDRVKGAAHPKTTLSFIEDISAKRSLRMITYGSFPLYLALFAPVTAARSIFLQDIVSYQQANGPFLFTVSGGIAAIVFFIGYMIVLNEYPFSIGFLMFTLGVLFSVLFIGIPATILSPTILLNVVVVLVFVLMMGIFSAFTPVFTNRQLLPSILGATLLGILAIDLGLL